MLSISFDIITNSPLINRGLISLPRTCSWTDEFLHVNTKSFITPHTFIKENPRNIGVLSRKFRAFEHLAPIGTFNRSSHPTLGDGASTCVRFSSRRQAETSRMEC